MQGFGTPSALLFFSLMALSFLTGLTGCADLIVKEQENMQMLTDYASGTRNRVQERLTANPESMLSESLNVLSEILRYADEVRSAPDRFHPDKIRKYTEQINIINENIERFKDLTLKTDVSFPIGTYRLSDLSVKGREECVRLAEKMITTVRELGVRYPGYSIRITLKTIGYTDDIPIVSGPLERTIRVNMKESPAGTESRRGSYNRVLSRLRAESISSYIMEHLRKGMPVHRDIKYVEKILGMGENFPHENAVPPYQARDERRRICIISPYIEILL